MDLWVPMEGSLWVEIRMFVGYLGTAKGVEVISTWTGPEGVNAMKTYYKTAVRQTLKFGGCVCCRMLIDRGRELRGFWKNHKPAEAGC